MGVRVIAAGMFYGKEAYFSSGWNIMDGSHLVNVTNKVECLEYEGNVWINRKYNFDDLGKALMSLFVLSSRDGWVNIMYTGLDSVGIDMQWKISIAVEKSKKRKKNCGDLLKEQFKFKNIKNVRYIFFF
uniref:CSON006236 protein n=1 Tax=Culicoides sonorensis TaxID=179676 RepID=A0A336LAT1_CULSO